MITLALTHFNRFPLLLEAVAFVLGDSRISEIVIVDDYSTDGSFADLALWARQHPKIKLFRNAKNLDCYANKAEAVRRSRLGAWVILLDSDNVLRPDYLDALEKAVATWDPSVIYCPEWAQPAFDYREWSGKHVNRHNIASLLGPPPPPPLPRPAPVVNKFPRRLRPWEVPAPKPPTKPRATLGCLLNTANYFVHREEYLECWDPDVNPYTADSIYMAYRWLASGRSLYVVPGLRYFHRMHEGSHYKLNWRKTGGFHKSIEDKLRQLNGVY